MPDRYYSGQPSEDSEILPYPPAYYESRPPYPVPAYNALPAAYNRPAPGLLPPPYYPPLPAAYLPAPQVVATLPVQTHLVYHVALPVYACPFCRVPYPPLTGQRISSGGWATFAVLVLLFFPLCWLGLLMKKQYLYCGHCQVRLN